MAFVELRQTIIEILADYFSSLNGLCENLWKLLSSLRQVARGGTAVSSS